MKKGIHTFLIIGLLIVLVSCQSNSNTGSSNQSMKDTNLNETVTIGDLFEITFTESEWTEEILPSNTNGVYSYLSDTEGEKYFVIYGTLKNLGSEDVDIKWISDAEIVINETYTYRAQMELEAVEGNSFYGSAKPLQTLNLIVFAEVSDEAYDIYDTIEVSMKIQSDPERINNFFTEDFPYETIKMKFSK